MDALSPAASSLAKFAASSRIAAQQSGPVALPPSGAVQASAAPEKAPREDREEQGASKRESEHSSAARLANETMRYLRKVIDPDVPDGLSETERAVRERPRAEPPPPPAPSEAADVGPPVSREGKPPTGTILNVVA